MPCRFSPCAALRRGALSGIIYGCGRGGRGNRHRAGVVDGARRATGIDAVPQDENRANDIRLITPLLVMGLIVVCGLLYFAYLGHA
jgi:hypothetical protein